MTFKTPYNFSKGQILTVIFVTPLAVFGLYLTITTAKVDFAFWIIILAVVAGMTVQTNVMIGWFQTCYTVELQGLLLKGWNLFGKEKSFDLTRTQLVSKVRGFYRFKLSDDRGQHFIICGDIDYYGFLMDYIFLHLPAKVQLDDEWLSKLRDMPRLWKYTKRMPAQTRYELGYIPWLEKLVEDQRIALVSRGILKSNTLYGEPQWKERYHEYYAQGKL